MQIFFCEILTIGEVRGIIGFEKNLEMWKGWQEHFKNIDKIIENVWFFIFYKIYKVIVN